MYNLENNVAWTTELKDAFKHNVTRGKIVYKNEQNQDITIDEDSGIKEIILEDNRYVPEIGFIGQATAKKVTLTLLDNLQTTNLENKEFTLYIGADYNEQTYYINYGNFIVNEPPQNDSTNGTIKIVAYDYMIKFNKNYNDDIIYPCTLKEYLQNICNQAGVILGTENFANDDFIVVNNQFEGKQLREILRHIAKSAFSWARIGQDNKLYLDFEVINTITETITINDYKQDGFKKANEYFGPVNKVMYGDSDIQGQEEVVVDDNSIEQYGEHEFVINDNYFGYTTEKRNQLIQAGSTLFGLTYMPVTQLDLIGLIYLDCTDLVEVEDEDENTITTRAFNHTIKYNGIIKDSISSEGESLNEQEYENKNTIPAINSKTEISVDRANKKVTSLVSEMGTVQGKLTSIEQNIDNIQNLFQITGGHNLIRNSMGLLGNDAWTKISQRTNVRFPGSSSYPLTSIQPLFYSYREPVYEFGYDANLIGTIVSVAKRKIQNGQIVTTSDNITNLIVGMQYTLSFIIDNDANTTTTIQLVGNKINYNRTWTTETRKEKVEFSFIAETTNYTFKMSSSTTSYGYGTIYDLMLNSGDVTPWEPAFAEIYSTIIRLSQMGLQVYCTGSDIATLMTAQGFQIRRFENDTLYEIVTEFTKDGIISKKSILEEMQLNNFEFKTIDYSGYETLIIYKKDSD